MIVIVCGGRDFTDYKFLSSTLDQYDIECIIHGFANGADKFSGRWARSRRIPEIIVPAQWTNYQKSAGAIRNSWMIKYTKADTLIAFPGGRGTQNMINQAHKNGLKVIKIEG